MLEPAHSSVNQPSSWWTNGAQVYKVLSCWQQTPRVQWPRPTFCSHFPKRTQNTYTQITGSSICDNPHGAGDAHAHHMVRTVKCSVMCCNSRTRSRPVDDYYFGQVFVTLSGRVGNLSPEFFHNRHKVSVSALLWEPIGTDHQRIRQRKLSPAKTSTCAARNWVFQLLLLLFSRSRDVTLCVNVGHPEKREVWPFQALDVVRTHQGEKQPTAPKKPKRPTLPYMVKRRIYSRRLPRRRETATAAPPSRLVTYIFSFALLHVDISSEIGLRFRHTTTWPFGR